MLVLPIEYEFKLREIADDDAVDESRYSPFSIPKPEDIFDLALRRASWLSIPDDIDPKPLLFAYADQYAEILQTEMSAHQLELRAQLDQLRDKVANEFDDWFDKARS
jgi:hypothetical protein